MFYTLACKVLNIEIYPVPTQDVIKEAYKKAALRSHPDKGGVSSQFLEVSNSYNWLKDKRHLFSI